MDPMEVAATYFESWQAKDFTALRSILADDVTFRGPLGTADDADSCLAGLKHLAEQTDDIVVQARCANGADVITWFDLHLHGKQPCPTANWSHVVDGRITRIRVAFDPRPLLDG